MAHPSVVNVEDIVGRIKGVVDEKTDRLLTHWVEAARGDITYREFAERHGISIYALKKMLERARKRNDPRAISNHDTLNLSRIHAVPWNKSY